ncbi:MAG: hypothetical protein NTX05_00265, partial [Fusobacteria bacterium]|nr:hypothetical protein [Fusobacteriota bacterium]
VWGVFIGMFFVVYLYLILGEWNFHVLESRIFETILAGIIVIAVSIILPVRVGEKIKPSTIRIIMGIQDIISEMRDAVLEEKTYCPSFTKGSQLMVLGNSMKTLILAARFENIFSSNKDKIAKRMIRSFQNYHISVEVLANALAHTQNSKLIKEKYLLFFNLVIEKSESMNKMFDAYFHRKVSKVKEESLNFSKINSEIISIGSPYSEMKFCTVDEKIDMFEIELKIKELSREMNFLKKWLIKLDQD